MKLAHIVLIMFLFLTIIAKAQINGVNRFPLQEFYQNNNESFLLGLANNNLIMFWFDSSSYQIKFSKSVDGGSSWYSLDSLVNIISTEKYVDIKGVVLPSGRILITYHSNIYYYVYSDDNCSSWSVPAAVPTRSGILARRKIFQSSLDVKANGEVSFIHSASQIYDSEDAKGIYSISSTDGINWTVVDTIDLTGKNGHIINIDTAKDILVYSDSTENDDDIFARTSINSGISWSERSLFIGGTLSQSKPAGIKDQNGKTWVFYNQEVSTPFSGILQSDIHYITSTDDGNSWSDPEKFTKYIGYDFIKSLSLWNGRPIISFKSSRDFSSYYRNYQIYLTLADEVVDTNAPPFMYLFNHPSEPPYPNQPYFIRTFVDDDREIVSVELNTNTNPPGLYETLTMYDDGTHNDSLPGDKIYGIEVSLPNYGDSKSYNFTVIDNDLNFKNFNGDWFTIPVEYALDKYLIDVNNFKFPLDNRGVLADAPVDGENGGKFDEIVALYSGGFFLSGNNNGSLWVNAVASSSLIRDYQAGVVGSSATDPANKLYIVKNSDQPFGTSWLEYQGAVEQGADFYDGNSDGIYNPVDLNSNNIWDTNEDRPDFLGDVTAWCVYNDAVPGSMRRWNDQQPMGIEIHQSVFAWGENVNDLIDNMIFVRYRIFNKGTVSNKFNDVYFSGWADPDIGGSEGSSDDLVGCDTLLGLGYMYNSGQDPSYGINPPAVGISFLQGPAAYIPGETFIDNNGNGIFDELIDVPLDTAYRNNGPVVGINVLPGAKNQNPSSFINYINGDPSLNDPNIGIEARNYMLGYDKFGNAIDPCSWAFSVVNGGANCATIDPRYWYSGDPLSNGGWGFGWLNSSPSDQRILINNGPFTLEENKPIDIVVCYLVGRGYDELNSISVMKNISADAIHIYNSNFTDIPTEVEDQSAIITEFKLSQNFPNPFNPSTSIQYAISSTQFVTLKVYDLLGREVATLVNEEKTTGSYEVEFDGNNLTSGIYFYKLKAGSFVETKKMILLK